MSNLTFRDVLKILRLVDAGPSCDFEVEFEGTRVKVSRRRDRLVALGADRTSSSSTAAPDAPADTSSLPEAGHAAAVPPPATSHFGAGSPTRMEVKSPMAGTFYAAPAPGAPPFVEVGRPVEKGEKLGIVEVMKLFTAVSSPMDGTVRAILVENEEFVQNDQTLMIIEAAG